MNFESERKLIAIVGPTASGKTAVGVKLAKEFNGEIVSADSRQVFRGLDIGTGKDLAEYGGIKYHMIDICDPEEDFNLFKYLELARAAIEDIFLRGKVPIVVGGTGLYVQGLIEGFELEKSETPNPKPETNSKISNQVVISTPQLCLRVEKSSNKRSLDFARDDKEEGLDDKHERDELEKYPIEQLQNILQELDIEAYEKLADRQNPHRLIRAIERAESGDIVEKKKPDFEVLQIGLEWPREELNKRIDERVDDRFEQGMLEEVIGLLRAGANPDWLLRLGLEYRIITDFLISNDKFLIPKSQLQNIKNSKEFAEMKELLKLRIHQYAKRQMTWFKRFPEIVWESDYEKINQLVKNYLN